jgi:hypothetical protein
MRNGAEKLNIIFPCKNIHSHIIIILALTVKIFWHKLCMVQNIFENYRIIKKPCSASFGEASCHDLPTKPLHFPKL